jgi:hypothetical protein
VGILRRENQEGSLPMELRHLGEPGHVAVRGTLELQDLPELLDALLESQVKVLHLERVREVPETVVEALVGVGASLQEEERSVLYVRVAAGSRLASQLSSRRTTLQLQVVLVPPRDDSGASAG